jgi:UDP-arabinose 4-epimerase
MQRYAAMLGHSHEKDNSLVDSRDRVCVLITGGAGYIGSHSARTLASAGFYPVVVDDLRTGHRSAVRWGPLIETDLADRAALNRVFETYPIAAVIHFAGSAYVGESMDAPQLYFQNNVGSTLSLLETMLDYGVTSIVFSSSCATYGHPKAIPITEEHPQQPVNPYGESKLMVEKMLVWYARAYGLRYTILRYFNAAGADPEGELGEMHDPEPHLIPRVIAAALGSLPTIEVYGTDYDTVDGTAVRDYIHVTDLAEAHVAAMRYLQSGGASAVFNLGTGRGHSVRQVISAIEHVSGRRVPFKDLPRRPGDPAELVADAHEAVQCLAWRPRHSDLNRIVQTAWAWHTSIRDTDPNAAKKSQSPCLKVRSKRV